MEHSTIQGYACQNRVLSNPESEIHSKSRYWDQLPSSKMVWSPIGCYSYTPSSMVSWCQISLVYVVALIVCPIPSHIPNATLICTNVVSKLPLSSSIYVLGSITNLHEVCYMFMVISGHFLHTSLWWNFLDDFFEMFYKENVTS